MEAEALRDVPGYMEGRGKGYAGPGDRPRSKGIETQPPIGHVPSDAIMIPVHNLTMATGGERRQESIPFLAVGRPSPGLGTR